MKAAEDKDFVQSLERGLAVIMAFAGVDDSQTLSDVARRTGLSRPTVRRLLLTLVRLGYVSQHQARFQLTSRVLELTNGYGSARGLQQLAQPVLEHLVSVTGEAAGILVLEGSDIVLIDSVAAPRIVGINLAVGARLPADLTAAGRVLLANLSPGALDAYFARTALTRRTRSTTTGESELRQELQRIRDTGWSSVNHELEDGLHDLSCPIRDTSGVIAAVGVWTQAGRTDADQLDSLVVPALLEAAASISLALGARLDA